MEGRLFWKIGNWKLEESTRKRTNEVQESRAMAAFIEWFETMNNTSDRSIEERWWWVIAHGSSVKVPQAYTSAYV
jgi:hypothetical protein